MARASKAPRSERTRTTFRFGKNGRPETAHVGERDERKNEEDRDQADEPRGLAVVGQDVEGVERHDGLEEIVQHRVGQMGAGQSHEGRRSASAVHGRAGLIGCVEGRGPTARPSGMGFLLGMTPQAMRAPPPPSGMGWSAWLSPPTWIMSERPVDVFHPAGAGRARRLVAEPSWSTYSAGRSPKCPSPQGSPWALVPWDHGARRQGVARGLPSFGRARRSRSHGRENRAAPWQARQVGVKHQAVFCLHDPNGAERIADAGRRGRPVFPPQSLWPKPHGRKTEITQYNSFFMGRSLYRVYRVIIAFKNFRRGRCHGSGINPEDL